MAVSWAYVDTSVLLKRYLREAGTAMARRILQRYRVVSSAIAPVEATSALCRRRAVGDIGETDFQAILDRLTEDRMHWELLELTGEVLGQAEQVIRVMKVRTLDANHLASALIFRAAAGTGKSPQFGTGDAQQRVAALGLGLEIVWVG